MSLGYFELGVTITPSHFISKNTYYLLTLTEKINYNFEICINIVLPSKVRVKITPKLLRAAKRHPTQGKCNIPAQSHDLMRGRHGSSRNEQF